MKQQIYSSLLLLLTAIIWGTAFVAQSVGMEYIEPFTFNGIRSMIGGAVLVPLLYWLEKPLQKKEREFPCSLENRQKKIDKTLLLGGICCGICLCAASNLQQIALQYVAVGKAGFLTACYIVIVPVLGLLFRKKCSSYLWCSVGMALIGLYFLCVKGSFSLEWADGLLLLSALLFAVHILVIDYFSPLVNDGVYSVFCMRAAVSFICRYFRTAAAFLYFSGMAADSLCWGAVLRSRLYPADCRTEGNESYGGIFTIKLRVCSICFGWLAPFRTKTREKRDFRMYDYFYGNYFGTASY